MIFYMPERARQAGILPPTADKVDLLHSAELIVLINPEPMSVVQAEKWIVLGLDELERFVY